MQVKEDETDHQAFMQIALQAAGSALDAGEFPVGCVLVSDGRVVASGARRNSRGEANELDHAEIVALRSLLDRCPSIDPSRVVVYSTMEPCLMCFSTLILNGIRTIVYAYEDVMGGGCGLELNRLAPLYSSMRVTVVSGVCRSTSLDLFKLFFSSPDNDYWQDSLLARYTLAQ